MNLAKIICINGHSMVPKYRQLMEQIVKGMGLDVSRNTVEKAYSKLKLKGIIGSVHGKGFFCTANQNQTL